jgi:hypothetical protein
MKTKFLLMSLALMVASVVPAFASGSVLDQVSVALLGHTETILETTTRGKTNAELLVTPIQIGRWDSEYIVGLDGGVLGNVKPNTIGESGYNWTAGIHVHLSPLIRRVLPAISPNYPALAALEINPRVSYQFRNHANEVKSGWMFGIGLGWSFSTEPRL